MTVDHELLAALIALDAPSMRARTMPLLDCDRRTLDIEGLGKLPLSSG